jgi:uncharacterized protein (TIGR03083 family)
VAGYSQAMLTSPEPILVGGLFPPERAALLGLLDSLTADDFERPTIAGDWTVKDIAGHLVADDLGRVSSQRDGYRRPWDPSIESLRSYIDRRNAEWVTAMSRLSPRVVPTLLKFSGAETQALFESLDPFALGPSVDWAGPEPAPVWLDLARELTERWHHQQQIRDAVGAPILSDSSLLRPVLATFAFSLPTACHGIEMPNGTMVQFTVEGPSGGDWTLLRQEDGWQLRLGLEDTPDALVTMDEDTAWRMYIRALPSDEVERRSRVAGDSRLALPLLNAFALVS